MRICEALSGPYFITIATGKSFVWMVSVLLRACSSLEMATHWQLGWDRSQSGSAAEKTRSTYTTGKQERRSYHSKPLPKPGLTSLYCHRIRNTSLRTALKTELPYGI